MAVLPVGFGASGGYTIDRSLRFRSSASAYLSRTPASAGNRQKFTWSGWVKLGKLTDGFLFSAGTSTSNVDQWYFNTSTNQLYFNSYQGAYVLNVNTNAVYRDPSAWYHIVLSVDTTQATSTNRIAIYVNGVSQALTAGAGGFGSQNQNCLINSTVEHDIGRYVTYTSYFDGYMTDVNFIDGQALDPTYFGEYNSDTGVWQPIKYTGTYGTNGFYLNFSDNSTTTTLGYDTSGNGNNWTANNISVTSGVTYDSMTDVPTLTSADAANYAVMNPLDVPYSSLLTQANLRYATSSPYHYYARHSFQLPSSGKWYWEVTATWDSSSRSGCGVFPSTTATTGYPWGTVGSYGWYLGSGTSNWYWSNNGSLAFNIVPSSPAVFQICYDADNGTIYSGINNTFYSSAGASTGNPSTLTNPTSSSVPVGLFPATGGYGSGSMEVNHGQRPFAYTPPAGFKSLNTYNLPDSTVEDGGEYFNAVLYTGNGTSQTVTGFGFNPDMVWHKGRSVAYGHSLVDVLRGNSNVIFSNATDAEQNPGAQLDLATDGATVTYRAANLANNQSSATYVIWGWKANGSGVSNTDGSITSTVSANTTAGFSIVTYTGTGAAATVGHGLGVAPRMVIVKSRSGAYAWTVYSASVGATYRLRLNETAAATLSTEFNNTTPTSTVFSVDGTLTVNGSAGTHVAYCFADVEGYSKFGSYTGNGSTDGPFVYTGFRPAFVMFKRTDSTSDWHLYDTSRSTYNVIAAALYADLSNAENSGQPFDILSNGFKLRVAGGELNTSSATIIYMAFAENPFKNSLAR
jgi:hypothetical protein